MLLRVPMLCHEFDQFVTAFISTQLYLLAARRIREMEPWRSEEGEPDLTDLAQAISWMTEPKSRNVQLNASPAAFQYGPRSPSRTSNHWSTTAR